MKTGFGIFLRIEHVHHGKGNNRGKQPEKLLEREKQSSKRVFSERKTMVGLGPLNVNNFEHGE